MSSDISITSESGLGIFKIIGFKVKRVTEASLFPASKTKLSSWMHQVEWEPQKLNESIDDKDQQEKSADQGQCLIFTDQKGVGKELAEFTG